MIQIPHHLRSFLSYESTSKRTKTKTRSVLRCQMYKIGCRLQKANHSARVTALRSPKNVANENPIVDLECDRNGAAMTCHPSVCVKCRQLCGGGGAAMQPTWTVKKLHVVSCTSLERAQHARCNTSLSQSGRGEVSVDRCATTSGPTTLVYVSRCFAML